MDIVSFCYCTDDFLHLLLFLTTTDILNLTSTCKSLYSLREHNYCAKRFFSDDWISTWLSPSILPTPIDYCNMYGIVKYLGPKHLTSYYHMLYMCHQFYKTDTSKCTHFKLIDSNRALFNDQSVLSAFEEGILIQTAQVDYNQRRGIQQLEPSTHNRIFWESIPVCMHGIYSSLVWNAPLIRKNVSVCNHFTTYSIQCVLSIRDLSASITNNSAQYSSIRYNDPKDPFLYTCNGEDIIPIFFDQINQHLHVILLEGNNVLSFAILCPTHTTDRITKQDYIVTEKTKLNYDKWEYTYEIINVLHSLSFDYCPIIVFNATCVLCNYTHILVVLKLNPKGDRIWRHYFFYTNLNILSIGKGHKNEILIFSLNEVGHVHYSFSAFCYNFLSSFEERPADPLQDRELVNQGYQFKYYLSSFYFHELSPHFSYQAVTLHFKLFKDILWKKLNEIDLKRVLSYIILNNVAASKNCYIGLSFENDITIKCKGPHQLVICPKSFNRKVQKSFTINIEHMCPNFKYISSLILNYEQKIILLTNNSVIKLLLKVE